MVGYSRSTFLLDNRGRGARLYSFYLKRYRWKGEMEATFLASKKGGKAMIPFYQ
jgi:hypothetical protein